VTPKERLRLLWRAAQAARGKADEVELRRQFLGRARNSGLTAAVGRRGEEDVAYVVSWALRGRDPWGSTEFSDG
jgi:hypothetical protein